MLAQVMDAPADNTQIYEGTNQIQRVVMSRQLLTWAVDLRFQPLGSDRAGRAGERPEARIMGLIRTCLAIFVPVPSQ